MITGWTVLSLTGSLIALCLSVVTLVYHWRKDTRTPDLYEVSRQLNALRAEHLDLWDKVDHWRKRDNVRKARAGREKQLEEDLPEAHPNLQPVTKAELRKRAAALRGLPSVEHG